MSVTPTLAQAFDTFVQKRVRGVMTSCPGRIESYDVAKQKASVQPLIELEYTGPDGSRKTERLPVIQGVPVMFGGMTYPLSKGDTVLITFCQSSIDKWLVTGGIVDPLDDRHHDINDAVCFPGLRPFSSPWDQAAEGATVIPGDDIRLGSVDASELLALKSDLTAFKSIFDAHIHPLSSGTSSPTATPFPAPVGTTKVKAE